jgi:hypothetical protein
MQAARRRDVKILGIVDGRSRSMPNTAERIAR